MGYINDENVYLLVCMILGVCGYILAKMAEKL